jgi:hypothetical protein
MARELKKQTISICGDPTMATLIISRPNWTFDGFRTYLILIDGALSQAISSGQTVRIELPPGHHDVVARVDWCRCKPLGIEMDPDGERYVRIGSVIKWWYFLFIPLFALASPYLHPVLSALILVLWCCGPELLCPRRYLNLREEDASEVAARRGDLVPHPDALPPIRLSESPLFFGQEKKSKEFSAISEL